MHKLHVHLQSQAPIALDAEFDCAPGELVALVGPSGSGKTSLLRAVAGLLHGAHLRGTVRVGNTTWYDSVCGVNLSPQDRRAGLVFQSYALFPHLGAMKNVAIGAGYTRVGGKNDAYIRALFERLGLGGLEQRLPAQLSGGQQQRVALARALMRLHMPESTPPGGRAEMCPGDSGVLLLDEPFSAVDAPTRQTLYRELAALRQHVSTPMVLVTHDLHEARRLADRVVILDAGRTLQSGTPAAVFSRPRNARVAQLVGIQNLFHGTFHPAGGGMGVLHWTDELGARVPLQVVDKGRIAHGMPVRWVLAGESVELVDAGYADADAAQAQPQPGDGLAAPTNLLWCELREVLELGETCLCTLVPQEMPTQRVTLTLATSHLRALRALPGCRLGLRIAPQAIHIMPVRA